VNLNIHILIYISIIIIIMSIREPIRLLLLWSLYFFCQSFLCNLNIFGFLLNVVRYLLNSFIRK
jgi:hypothetical protein